LQDLWPTIWYPDAALAYLEGLLSGVYVNKGQNYSLVASNGSLCKQSKKISVNSTCHDCFYVADKGNYLL